MNHIEWARVCTPDQFITEVLSRWEQLLSQEDFKQAVAELAARPELKAAVAVYIWCNEALSALNRPERHAMAQAVLDRRWANKEYVRFMGSDEREALHDRATALLVQGAHTVPQMSEVIEADMLQAWASRIAGDIVHLVTLQRFGLDH